MFFKVPLINDPHLDALLEKGPHEKAIFPLELIDFSEALREDSSKTVNRYIAKHQGSLQWAYSLWFVPEKLYQGKPWALWRSPQGELRDVTPKTGDEQGALFVLSKENLESEKSIFLKLGDSKLIDILLQMEENPPKLREQFEDLAQPKGSYINLDAEEPELKIISSPSPTKIGRNDPCFCGSQKKFKKCCGK